MDTPSEMIRDFKEGKRHPILIEPEKRVAKHLVDEFSPTPVLVKGSNFGVRSPLSAKLSTDDVLKLVGSSTRMLLRKNS